ncbi:MAG: alpha/beta hydrolase domain-containing protein [Burkholderiaceae bacterium]
MISAKQSMWGGASFGAVGAYEQLTGTAYGRLDPKDPKNARMVFIDKAPLDSDGLVEYSTDFLLMRPVDATKGNSKIFYNVVNRGSDQSLNALNKGSLTTPGNGFLMNQGYEMVWAGWQPEANANSATYKAHFPIATNGSQPIVSQVLEVYIPDMAEGGSTLTIAADNTFTSTLTYPPLSRDASTERVSLTVRERYDDPRVPLSPSLVTFVNDTTVRIDMKPAIAMGFDQGAIYELVYTAKNPYVGGMGFAMVRDLISYLRNQTMDSAGNENPARPGGMAIKTAIGWGHSQSGRFLKDMVYQGFNQDVSGKRVFDGIIGLVTGSRVTDHNTAFAQSSRWLRQHEERNYPAADFPFTYQTVFDPLTGKTDGLLATCTATSTCPKIFQDDSDFEAWNGRLSLMVTDPTGNALTNLPTNVRLYEETGAPHSPSNGVPGSISLCKLQSNPIDYSAISRAMVVDMDQWITAGVDPPTSLYPNLTDGTLQTVAQEQATFPTIPGFLFSNLIVPAQVGDYSTVPPTFGASYPVFVPKTDASGNPIGGIISPDIAAPLGTYMGRNFRKAGHAEDEMCGGNSGFIAFAKTKAARLASGDTRPSLEELYPNGQTDFVAKRRAQVQALIQSRLVLPGELDSLTNAVAYPQ